MGFCADALTFTTQNIPEAATAYAANLRKLHIDFVMNISWRSGLRIGISWATKKTPGEASKDNIANL
jgi:hypothetical protein